MSLICARLQGHSVVICGCKIANGFLPCPAEARGVLTPTYPPAAYVQEGFNRPIDSEITATAPAPAPARSVPHLAYSASGYTGSICDACGSLRMRRSGTCETCDDCGNAGGCG